MTHHAPITASLGWVCPRCDRSHAPGVVACDCRERRAPLAGKLSIAAIVAAVAFEFNVTTGQILGNCRRREYVRPRFAAIRLAREITGKSLPEIGMAFDRDHTSILHALRKPMDADERLRMARARETLLQDAPAPVRPVPPVTTECVRDDTMHAAQIAAMGETSAQRAEGSGRAA